MERYYACPRDMGGNNVQFDEYGFPYSVDQNTGEIIQLATTYLRPGDVAYSSEAREARKRRLELEQNRHMIHKANQGEPLFTFVNTTEEFADLSPASVVRLVVIGTYSNYRGVLMLDNHNAMQYSHLQGVLKLGRTAVQDFWREVSPRYIVERDGNLVLTDQGTFLRGKINDNNTRWIKTYNRAVRDLYRATSEKQHKHLGHVFRMLRYINIQHNILCYNPMERNCDYIVPMTFGQFCEEVGYSTNQISRQISYLMKLKFHVGDHEEHFCKSVANDRYLVNSWIFINPNVLYSGTDPESVANFAVLSKKPNAA